MYKPVVFILALFGTALSFAQSKVVASISNMKNNNGVCRACLFSNAVSFSSLSQPYNCIIVSVRNKQSTAVFDKVQPGAYALFVFHDVNNNSKMDKNFLGIPKEGYGASRNKLPFAAAPCFEENKFNVSDNHVVQLNIHLRNCL